MMFLARLGGGAQIDHRVRVPEQLAAAGGAHAQIFAAGRIEKAPAVAEAITRQRLANQLQVGSGVGHRTHLDRVINIGPVILQVINLEAEPAKADEMMQQLPDHARERIAEGEMQNDDSASGFSFHQAYKRCP